MRFENVRLDYRFIYQLVEQNSKVLDLGCGDGELMFFLAREKNANVQGIELDEQAIYKCVAKGLSVFHGDIDRGLSEYPERSFDYVILNMSLQQVRNIDFVIAEALRVGKQVIIGFPNFAHYRARIQLFFRGKSPVVPALPYSWYNTPNLRFLSIRDFTGFCREEKIEIKKEIYLGKKRRVFILPNLFADMAILLLERAGIEK